MVLRGDGSVRATSRAFAEQRVGFGEAPQVAILDAQIIEAHGDVLRWAAQVRSSASADSACAAARR